MTIPKNYHGFLKIKIDIELPYGGNRELARVYQWS
jgi:hypothetical protein